MSVSDVDAYLDGLDDPQRTTLAILRWTLRSLLPEAEEAMSYGVPTFKVAGKAVAGFAAYRDHCSYLPMSGSVLSSLGDEVAGYSTSKGALKFPVDEPLPRELVTVLVSQRQAEIAVTLRP
jgi:uncharacterized protein YdhG (YjbR/CyaY superfamily)